MGNGEKLKKHILTIAGSDPSAGAGIQADLKTITCLGAYGMTALTALTAQNPWEVTAIHQVPPAFLAAQMDAILGKIRVDAIKTGMLPNDECIRLVADRLRKHGVSRAVIDPVVVAASGARLIDQTAFEALQKELFPLAGLVTPNIAEAEFLSGLTIESIDDMRKAASLIKKMGPKSVLIKGGHLPLEYAVDLLLDDRGFHEFSSPRFETEAVHGTGCTVASAIATLWAIEGDLLEALGKAKKFISIAIESGVFLGDKPGTPDQTAILDFKAALMKLA